MLQYLTESALELSLQKCCHSTSKVLPSKVNGFFTSVKFAKSLTGEVNAQSGQWLKYRSITELV